MELPSETVDRRPVWNYGGWALDACRTQLDWMSLKFPWHVLPLITFFAGPGKSLLPIGSAYHGATDLQIAPHLYLAAYLPQRRYLTVNGGEQAPTNYVLHIYDSSYKISRWNGHLAHIRALWPEQFDYIQQLPQYALRTLSRR